MKKKTLSIFILFGFFLPLLAGCGQDITISHKTEVKLANGESLLCDKIEIWSAVSRADKAGFGKIDNVTCYKNDNIKSSEFSVKWKYIAEIKISEPTVTLK